MEFSFHGDSSCSPQILGFHMKYLFFSLPLLFSCTETKTDDSGASSTETGLGTCKHTGGVDSNDGILRVCMEPTGSAWELDNFISACETHWDLNASHDTSTDSCPPEELVGQCMLNDGGALIGASFDGDTYGGKLYYYTENNYDDPEDHCVGLSVSSKSEALGLISAS